MKQLREIITDYFPQEEIKRFSEITLRDFWSADAGKIPLSRSKFFYLKPMDMVETDKKFYFDRRQSYLYQARITTVIGSVVLIIALYVIAKYLWKIELPLYIGIFVVLITLSISAINIFINQGVANILVICKEWVQKTYQEGEEFIIEGEMPKGGSYQLGSYITNIKRAKLSLLDRIFTPIINSPVPVKFTLRIKEV